MQHEKGSLQKGEARDRDRTNEEELTPGDSAQSRAGGTLGTRRDVPAWWVEVPAAEKAVIWDVLTAIRGLKGSRCPHVGRAARKWERSIGCFIKVRLIGENQSTERRKRKGNG